MSKVISFRLNADNQREAEALIILQQWQSQGFSTRYTITESLLCLGSVHAQETDNGAVNDLTNQIKELLEIIEIGSSREIMIANKPVKENLSAGFVSSILISAKPGLKSSV